MHSRHNHVLQEVFVPGGRSFGTNPSAVLYSNYIVLCSRKGIIKKTTLEAYSRPRQNGVNAITIKEGDQLLEAKLTNGKNDIMLAVKSGKAIRFPEEKVRPMGRTASGVRGITLGSEDDEVIPDFPPLPAHSHLPWKQKPWLQQQWRHHSAD